MDPVEHHWINADGFIKEIKNASECIVELYKHAGIFGNTREVFLKISKCLYNSAMHEDEVFYFF